MTQELKGLDRIKLPKYSLSEELMSAISHGLGVALSVVILVTCIVVAGIHHNGVGVVASVIYGLTSTILYLISTLYHALARNKAKKVFRILDHCSIYLLIAGTYTPFALVTLRNVNNATGWMVFAVVWICALVGILLTTIDMNKYKIPGLLLYLVMGWVVIFTLNTLIAGISKIALNYMITAGVIYTVGALIYCIGKKIKYMHSVFHVFVLIASLLFYLSIINYVL